MPLDGAVGEAGGAVVALEPSTGKVRVMASVPSFDPNTVPDQCSELNTPGRLADREPPDPVALPAGLDDEGGHRHRCAGLRRVHPDSTSTAARRIDIGGVPLSNFGGQSYGSVDLTTALTNSVNTVWAQVAETLGNRTMFEYMDRFGFNEIPPLDFPGGRAGRQRRLLEGQDDEGLGRRGHRPRARSGRSGCW